MFRLFETYHSRFLVGIIEEICNAQKESQKFFLGRLCCVHLLVGKARLQMFLWCLPLFLSSSERSCDLASICYKMRRRQQCESESRTFLLHRSEVVDIKGQPTWLLPWQFTMQHKIDGFGNRPENITSISRLSLFVDWYFVLQMVTLLVTKGHWWTWLDICLVGLRNLNYSCLAE